MHKTTRRAWHELAAGEQPEVRPAGGAEGDRYGDRAASPRPRRLRGAPGPAVRAAADGRPVHLLRPDGSGGVPARPGDRRTAASAHRAGHRHLSDPGRDHPSRQPGHAAGDPARRGQLDDRGPWHRPFRAHGSGGADRWRAAVRHPDLGGAARARRGDRTGFQPSRGGRAAADHGSGHQRAPDRGLSLRPPFAGLDLLRDVLRGRGTRGRRAPAARRQPRGARHLHRRGRDRDRGRHVRGDASSWSSGRAIRSP